jgi:hypothetical protein
MQWAVAVLVVLSLCWLVREMRRLDRRVRAIAAELRPLDEASSANTEAARRAHLRLDNHHAQIGALGRDLGWVDDRAHTRVLTGKMKVPPDDDA